MHSRMEAMADRRCRRLMPPTSTSARCPRRAARQCRAAAAPAQGGLLPPPPSLSTWARCSRIRVFDRLAEDLFADPLLGGRPWRTARRRASSTRHRPVFLEEAGERLFSALARGPSTSSACASSPPRPRAISTSSARKVEVRSPWSPARAPTKPLQTSAPSHCRAQAPAGLRAGFPPESSSSRKSLTPHTPSANPRPAGTLRCRGPGRYRPGARRPR